MRRRPTDSYRLCCSQPTEGLVGMAGVPQWLAYTVLGVVVVAVVVARQLRERPFTPRQAFVPPAILLVLAFTDDKLGRDLSSAGAVVLLGLGLLLAVATGAARAATMRVRRVGARVLVKGDG